MKKYISMLCLALLALASCDDSEDALQNKIDFSSPYVITDDPDDPVQHHRYLIYEEYGVPVFFNDTVSSKYIGQDHFGKPIYQHETLDFNWSFNSNNNTSVTYIYDYLEDPEEQETALCFVDEFLKEVSEPMRPFSIFLSKTLKINSTTQGTSEPDFWVGFRTLIVPCTEDFFDKDIPVFTKEILKNMVKDRVVNNSTVADAFGAASSVNNYYGKDWVADLKCVWGVEHKGVYWKPENLYSGRRPENAYINDPYGSCVSTKEEFEAERALIFQQIGQFGFICGYYEKSLSHTTSPHNVQEDLKYYLDQMMALGSARFEERYCTPPLVQEKYEILRDYINETLGVEF